MFYAIRAPILHQDYHYLKTELPLEPLYLGVPSRAPKMVKSCTYLAPKLTLSPHRLKRDSILHTSSRSSIGCL
jgi:hypothetical protein